MKEQLTAYVNLLFAAAEDCDEIQEEILRNTLEHYDDLIAQGRTPAAAYRLAIGSIGDINEILDHNRGELPSPSVHVEDTGRKKLFRAIGVMLYILCPIPLILTSETGLEIYGMCGLLLIVAVATALLIIDGKHVKPVTSTVQAPSTPSQRYSKAIGSLLGTLAAAAYLVAGFAFDEWFVSLLIFPIAAAIRELIRVIFAWKECG